MISGLGNFYKKLGIIEIWFRMGIAMVFIMAGVFEILRLYL
jgi:hypothetical protein